MLCASLCSTICWSEILRNLCAYLQTSGKKRKKPYLTPQQFDRLVELIPEPYASMVYVAIYTGLRVSELAGLRWNTGPTPVTVDEKVLPRRLGGSEE